MKHLREVLSDHIVNQAKRDAIVSDDFRLSRLLTPLLDLAPVTFYDIIGDVKRTLGEAAYTGSIYAETSSGGNRVTDSDSSPGEVSFPIRVNITHRGEQPMQTAPVRKLSYGTLRAIAQFPDTQP